MFPELIPAEGPARPPPPARRAATPALFSPSERAERRFWEFFTAHIRNPNTRLAYLAAVRRFGQGRQNTIGVSSPPCLAGDVTRRFPPDGDGANGSRY